MERRNQRCPNAVRLTHALLARTTNDHRTATKAHFGLELSHERRCPRSSFAENGDGARGSSDRFTQKPNQGGKLLVAASEPVDVEAAGRCLVARQSSQSGTVSSLRLETHPRRIRRGV